MAIQRQTTGNRKHFDMIRSFQPAGSSTVVWVQDQATRQLVRILRWGNDLYLPVYDGMQIGIGVYNGSGSYRAYPTYIEARNLWDNGQSQPELCDTDHMWEVYPYSSMVMDKLMNPDRQEGRPLIVTASGFGRTVGEATFGTDAYRGQIRVYERLQFGGGYQRQRQENQGYADHDVLESGPQTMGFDPGTLRGAHAQPKGLRETGRAGIGAGAAKHQGHHDTGAGYQSNAQPVIRLYVEYRHDLQPMLNAAWQNTPKWSWFEPIPTGNQWWNDPWHWRNFTRPTAPEIPVTPHRPNEPYRR